MIAALGEGIAQSLLPCSWTILLPAIGLGLATRRVATFAAFAGTVVLVAWVTVAGWFVGPLLLAGITLLAGGLLWWRLGARTVSAVMIGAGAAWAWEPCVGPELGDALTTAVTDPVGALGGLAMFLLGLIVVGLFIGFAIGTLFQRFGRRPSPKVGAVIALLLGLSMLIGVYPHIASTFARWSTALWA